MISIHALREEGDSYSSQNFSAVLYFYPRPPRGGRPMRIVSFILSTDNFYPRPPRGGRRNKYGSLRSHTTFLSTPSARRATHVAAKEGRCSVFLSTPSARRATSFIVVCIMPEIYFYPRPPRGGRLLSQLLFLMPFFISIHALREEGDPVAIAVPNAIFYFYPRPPRGGRPLSTRLFAKAGSFLSTPSARRATAKMEKNISAFVSL